MLVELGTGVDVGSLDGVEDQLCHAHTLDVDEVRLEKDLCSPKALAPQLHHTPVWELGVGRGGGGGEEGEGRRGRQVNHDHIHVHVHIFTIHLLCKL